MCEEGKPWLMVKYRRGIETELNVGKLYSSNGWTAEGPVCVVCCSSPLPHQLLCLWRLRGQRHECSECGASLQSDWEGSAGSVVKSSGGKRTTKYPSVTTVQVSYFDSRVRLYFKHNSGKTVYALVHSHNMLDRMQLETIGLIFKT